MQKKSTEAKEVKARKKCGKPPLPEAVFDVVLERIAEGESLVSICKDKEAGMPAYSSVTKKLANDSEYAARYTRARESQADKLFDDILEIADDGSNDTYIDKHGNAQIDQEVVARSRLRIDARKWMAAKLKPKVYSDQLKVDANVTATGLTLVVNKLDAN